MVKKIALLLCVTILMITGNNYAQKTCNTDEVYNKLKAEHPEIAVYEQQLEHMIRDKMANSLAKTTNTPDTTTYDIPIVVHVIHNYGPENLSDDDIYNAVAYWATVYVGTNYADTASVIQPFKKYIGNPRMRLHLATIDPSGNPTKGIVRHASYLTYNGGDNAKLDDWPPTSYINIWFVNVFNGAYANAAAYAYYPSAGAGMPYYDGVIGLYTYLNYDKAIPHEIGHVLNLQHPWGNTNQPGVACGDDLVDDTPPTKGHNPVGCVASALFDTTCTSANNIKTYADYRGILDSIVHYPDTVNSQNIMDYTYCQLMFTNLQVVRMRAALTSTVAGRSTLWSPANLAATGALAPMPDLAPIADYSVDKATSLVGNTVEPCYFLQLGSTTHFKFTNQSWNDTVSSVQWTLSNGASAPTSSSLTSLVETFSQPGWVTISLNAMSNAGSNTLTNKQAVYVADSVAMNPHTYKQNFTDSASSANWPTFNYYNNQFKWGLYNGAGYNDNSCMQFRSFDDRTTLQKKTGSPNGDHDDMFTPAFDLTTLSGNEYLNFYTSGSFVSGGQSPTYDTLDIYVSITGGFTWIKLSSLSGASLNNITAQSSEFVPTATAQWVPQTIAIPTSYQTAKTFFKFRYRSGDHGNNMYMDNFYISNFPTEVSEVRNTPNAVKIYPNPSNDGCYVSCVAGADGVVKFQVSDITGRVIYAKDEFYNSNSLAQQHIDKSVFQACGVYLVTVIANGQRSTQKIVIN